LNSTTYFYLQILWCYAPFEPNTKQQSCKILVEIQLINAPLGAEHRNIFFNYIFHAYYQLVLNKTTLFYIVYFL
jgi:hypothetical protein